MATCTFSVASATRTALTAIADDSFANPPEPGQLLGIDMDYVARLLPVEPLHRRREFQIQQAANAQGIHPPCHGRQRRTHELGNPLHGAALARSSTACCSCCETSFRLWGRRTLLRYAGAIILPVLY
jgi:hypothetical protein